MAVPYSERAYYEGEYNGVLYTKENPLEVNLSTNVEDSNISVKIGDDKSFNIAFTSVETLIGLTDACIGLGGNSLSTTLKFVSAGPMGIMSTFISFVRDTRDGESKTQALISSTAGGLTTTGLAIGAGVLVATVPSLAILGTGFLAVGTGMVIGYGASQFGNLVNSGVDWVFENPEVIIEFKEDVKADSLEAWEAVKNISTELKDLMNEGVTDIKLEFSDKTTTFTDYLSEIPSSLEYIADFVGESFINLLSELRNEFHQAEAKKSPLILDLDGNGVKTTSLENSVNFDHDNNGFAEETAWS